MSHTNTFLSPEEDLQYRPPDRDSVFFKISRITNRKYLKGIIGLLHFSMNCFTILQEWTDGLMWLL